MTAKEAKEIDCPHCGAKAGRSCITYDGKLRNTFHQARYHSADATCEHGFYGLACARCHGTDEEWRRSKSTVPVEVNSSTLSNSSVAEQPTPSTPARVGSVAAYIGITEDQIKRFVGAMNMVGLEIVETASLPQPDSSSIPDGQSSLISQIKHLQGMVNDERGQQEVLSSLEILLKCAYRDSSSISTDEQYLKQAADFLTASEKMNHAPLAYMVAAAFKNGDRALVAEASLESTKSLHASIIDKINLTQIAGSGMSESDLLEEIKGKLAECPE